MLIVDEPVARFLERRTERSTGRESEWRHRAAAVPRSVHTGLLAALAMVRRRDPSLLGALACWGFDIGALWASYRAFGHSPPGAVLVTGYYIGTAGNVLPVPGGIGGVEAGMIGAFVGSRVRASLTTLAVLGYRTLSYWLPTLPGAIAWSVCGTRPAHAIPSRSDPRAGVAAYPRPEGTGLASGATGRPRLSLAAMTRPNRKPPTCAKNATPPPLAWAEVRP